MSYSYRYYGDFDEDNNVGPNDYMALKYHWGGVHGKDYGPIDYMALKFFWSKRIIPPIIDLVTPNVMFILKDFLYIDEAVASDDNHHINDIAITPNITGTVDTSTAGIYLLEISATDARSQTSTELRKVHVFEKVGAFVTTPILNIRETDTIIKINWMDPIRSDNNLNSSLIEKYIISIGQNQTHEVPQINSISGYTHTLTDSDKTSLFDDNTINIQTIYKNEYGYSNGITDDNKSVDSPVTVNIIANADPIADNKFISIDVVDHAENHEIQLSGSSGIPDDDNLTFEIDNDQTTLGNLSVLSDGLILYSPNFESELYKQDSFKYKVKNTNDVESTEATVDIVLNIIKSEVTYNEILIDDKDYVVNTLSIRNLHSDKLESSSINTVSEFKSLNNEISSDFMFIDSSSEYTSYTSKVMYPNEVQSIPLPDFAQVEFNESKINQVWFNIGDSIVESTEIIQVAQLTFHSSVYGELHYMYSDDNGESVDYFKLKLLIQNGRIVASDII